MSKIINPKTKKPYTQSEMQEAYEKGETLPIIIGYEDGIGDIYSVHMVSKIYYFNKKGLLIEKYV